MAMTTHYKDLSCVRRCPGLGAALRRLRTVQAQLGRKQSHFRRSDLADVAAVRSAVETAIRQRKEARKDCEVQSMVACRLRALNSRAACLLETECRDIIQQARASNQEQVRSLHEDQARLGQLKRKHEAAQEALSVENETLRRELPALRKTFDRLRKAHSEALQERLRLQKQLRDTATECARRMILPDIEDEVQRALTLFISEKDKIEQELKETKRLIEENSEEAQEFRKKAELERVRLSALQDRLKKQGLDMDMMHRHISRHPANAKSLEEKARDLESRLQSIETNLEHTREAVSRARMCRIENTDQESAKMGSAGCREEVLYGLHKQLMIATAEARKMEKMIIRKKIQLKRMQCDSVTGVGDSSTDFEEECQAGNERPPELHLTSQLETELESPPKSDPKSDESIAITPVDKAVGSSPQEISLYLTRYWLVAADKVSGAIQCKTRENSGNNAIDAFPEDNSSPKGRKNHQQQGPEEKDKYPIFHCDQIESCVDLTCRDKSSENELKFDNYSSTGETTEIRSIKQNGGDFRNDDEVCVSAALSAREGNVEHTGTTVRNSFAKLLTGDTDLKLPSLSFPTWTKGTWTTPSPQTTKLVAASTQNMEISEFFIETVVTTPKLQPSGVDSTRKIPMENWPNSALPGPDTVATEVKAFCEPDTNLTSDVRHFSLTSTQRREQKAASHESIVSGTQDTENSCQPGVTDPPSSAITECKAAAEAIQTKNTEDSTSTGASSRGNDCKPYFSIAAQNRTEVSSRSSHKTSTSSEELDHQDPRSDGSQALQSLCDVLQKPPWLEAFDRLLTLRKSISEESQRLSEAMDALLRRKYRHERLKMKTEKAAERKDSLLIKVKQSRDALRHVRQCVQTERLKLIEAKRTVVMKIDEAEETQRKIKRDMSTVKNKQVQLMKENSKMLKFIRKIRVDSLEKLKVLAEEKHLIMQRKKELKTEVRSLFFTWRTAVVTSSSAAEPGLSQQLRVLCADVRRWGERHQGTVQRLEGYIDGFGENLLIFYAYVSDKAPPQAEVTGDDEGSDCAITGHKYVMSNATEAQPPL